MASSPLRAPAGAGQPQSRLMDMQKKFQQKHLANVAAIKGVAGSTTSSTSSSTTSTSDGPVPPTRRFGVSPQQQKQRGVIGGGGVGSVADGGDSLVQVDVKGKVRQLFAERNQQSQTQGPGYQHHQQLHRQRRRSLTGRDRSRPLRPLSDTEDDPLSKTVCFTTPSLAGGADLVGIKSTGGGGDVRRELLALFGRLPNLGGKLLSESFRGGTKMKTAQSAPELKWLLDGGSGPGGGGRGPGPPPPAEAPGNAVKGPAAGAPKARKAVAGGGHQAADSGDDDEDGDDDEQLPQRPAGRINSKTATVTKKPLATVDGGNGANPNGLGRVAKKPLAASNGGSNGGGKPAGGSNLPTNRLLLPPVVQPTVINALAAGAGAAAAVASVSAATAAGAQKPLVRAAKLPPATPGQQQQKPTAPRRLTTPPSKPVAAPRQPVAKRTTVPAARPLQPVKSQLSADRGPPAPGMARCPLCSRDFAADRLPKHEQVCQRTRDRDRKRKVFDTSRKRLEAVAAEAGVDVSSFKKKSQKEDQRAAEKLKKKKDAWRRKHDQLVRNVRAARAVQRHLAAGGSVRDLPPELENAGADPDDEADSDLVKCPHCGRSFNEAAADRHIPLCADRQRNAAARMQNKKR